ncbi:MAG TPA: hypothetical protein VNA04_18750 [Thermoanaerobaculia bacterium]|nr:hypothetical protein [Thermoanaerobaculia bacterium]
MNSILIEPLLRRTTIDAIDRVAARIADAEVAKAASVARLLRAWNDLDRHEKEHVVATMIAIGSAAVTAIVALKKRGKPLKKLRKRARKAAKRIAG